MNKKELAELLARRLFECGSSQRQTKRLALKSGEWPDNERDEGGMCEEAVVAVFLTALDDVDLL